MARAFHFRPGFELAGDQPSAVEELARALAAGEPHVVLLGATGTGKTATMAAVIEKLQRPALVIAPNKTLAAQLTTEFKEFFPDNAVGYFVSYYDYYQPEAYVPQTDTYIEKDATINDEVDRLRHSATSALLTRRDTLIVASVSCIFGLGSPQEYETQIVPLVVGEDIARDDLVRRLVDLQYDRNDANVTRGRFRARGDTLEIHPAYEELLLRVELFGDTVERLAWIDPVTGELRSEEGQVVIFPASHYVTSPARMQRAMATIEQELNARLKELQDQNMLLEAQRLRMRTHYDLEMMREIGYCNGIENYSRHIDGRSPGEAPFTLLDYFPKDYVVFLDESHMTVPQLHGMYEGDRSRKETLVEHGFRLPSAMDNRPLRFEEFVERVNQVCYVSATPGPYEMRLARTVAEQIVRPTGLVDPEVIVRPTKGQIDDLIAEIRTRVEKDQRVLVTTLTKKMAEDLTDYLLEMGMRVRYLHSEIDTVQRIEILRDLRLGEFDVLVGINLLREGLDLPEVTLVAILDADKEGFLRSATSLIQIIGRTARNVEGQVIMYADQMTDSMKEALTETDRRRQIQLAYNAEHGIKPETVRKHVTDILLQTRPQGAPVPGGKKDRGRRKRTETTDMPLDELKRLILVLEEEMREAARDLRFEYAARLRDEVSDLKRELREVHGQPA
ncbi:MAG TPA: excinuclease ABC subunit UvrB [Actinomycetota bacterium]|nr:excinuclease ABC subunit UvrB [Actinomycetota bacterium]